MEKIMWLVLGGAAFVAALRAGHSPRALKIGRWTVGILFVVFGAAVNAVYLATDSGYYAKFAEPSPFAFVRDTWVSLVVPHLWFFIGLLIVGEAVAGTLVLIGGRWTQTGLVALIAFHVGQLAFGGVLWVWAPLMIITLSLLLRAERATAATTAAGRPRSGGTPSRSRSTGRPTRWPSSTRRSAGSVSRHPSSGPPAPPSVKGWRASSTSSTRSWW